MSDERTRAPTDAELLQWLAKTCEERYPYQNGQTLIQDWRPTDDTVRPVGYGVLRQLNAHIAALTRRNVALQRQLKHEPARIRKLALEIVHSETEAPGPMPLEFHNVPIEDVARAAIRATKQGIAGRIAHADWRLPDLSRDAEGKDAT